MWTRFLALFSLVNSHFKRPLTNGLRRVEVCHFGDPIER